MDFENLYCRIIEAVESSKLLKRIVIILFIVLITIVILIEAGDKILAFEKNILEVISDSNASSKNKQAIPEQQIQSVSKEQEFEIIPLQSSDAISSNRLPGNVYLFNVESGEESWILTGMWHVTGKRYYSFNHSFWYGNEDKSNYDTGSANSGELISPTISLDNDIQPVLHFQSWYQTRSNDNLDRKLIQISVNNVPWIDLKQISHEKEKWVEDKIDLSDYRGNKIRIRFFFDTVDKNYNKYEGWYIDDITINGG